LQVIYITTLPLNTAPKFMPKTYDSKHSQRLLCVGTGPEIVPYQTGTELEHNESLLRHVS